MQANNKDTKASYTKGKWQQKDVGKYYIVNTQDLIKQRIICSVYGNDEETDANLKLIAAAPDLFEALQPFITLLNEIPESKIKQGGAIFAYNNCNLTIEDLLKAKQAIKKATEQ